jgi:preprotein translocase subunit SecE
MKIVELRHELQRTVWPATREVAMIGLLIFVLNSAMGAAMVFLDTLVNAAILRLLNI